MFCGYAVCEELQAVFCLVSDYADKRSAEDNAQRCIEAHTGITPAHVTFCKFADADKSTELYEEAEQFARDLVTGCYGVDVGYTFFSDPIDVCKQERKYENELKDIAKEYKQSYTTVLKMFYAYRGITEEHDNERAIRDFERLMMRMSKKWKE